MKRTGLVGRAGEGQQAGALIRDDGLLRRGEAAERDDRQGLGGGPGGLGVLAPDAARRDLDDGHRVGHRVRERHGLGFRPGRGSDSLATMAVYLGFLGWDLRVDSPPELADEVRALAGRYQRALVTPARGQRGAGRR